MLLATAMEFLPEKRVPGKAVFAKTTIPTEPDRVIFT
jgi:hypothetical protein